ncbi:MAG: hypothetical protein HKN44_16080 [Ilumatobacter sp.]|nr:hypothetical protein [Ilumatobacter sp.]
MTAHDATTDLDALRTLVDAQQAQIEDLAARLTSLAPRVEAASAVELRSTATTRRNMLTKSLVAGAVGAVGAAVATRPVAAADGDNMKLGETNEAASTTMLNQTSSTGDTTLDVRANGTGRAVQGISPSGVGVNGRSTSGDAVFGQVTTGRGLVGNATTSGIGLSAFSDAGIGAVVGSTSGTPLQIQASSTVSGAPTSGFHPAGALFVDVDNRLFYNRVSGSPGVWIQLDTPSGVSFTATPERAYDSRPGEPGSGTKGKFAKGQTRIIDLTLDTSVLSSHIGALLNVTVTGTTNGGFAAIYSAANATLNPPAFSSVNWTATDQTIGNNAQTAISEGKIKVFAVDATHVIIDVIGFII